MFVAEVHRVRVQAAARTTIVALQVHSGHLGRELNSKDMLAGNSNPCVKRAPQLEPIWPLCFSSLSLCLSEVIPLPLASVCHFSLENQIKSKQVT